jgi:hypothetical protein
MTLFYPDVSNLQWSSNAQVTTWCSQLLSSGFAGAVHKVSEGNYFADSFWPTFSQYCQANSIPYLGYHYVTTDSAASQASLFTQNNGGINVMLDIEANSGDIDNVWSVVNAFNAAGVNVQLAYLPQWYWGNIGSPDLSSFTSNGILLVSSAYPGGTGFASAIYASGGGDTGEGWAPYGNCTPSAWQFSDQATVGGINVDCNAYLGENIGALFGTSAAPTPPPTPPAPPAPPANTYLGLPTDPSIFGAVGAISAQLVGGT